MFVENSQDELAAYFKELLTDDDRSTPIASAQSNKDAVEQDNLPLVRQPQEVKPADVPRFQNVSQIEENPVDTSQLQTLLNNSFNKTSNELITNVDEKSTTKERVKQVVEAEKKIITTTTISKDYHVKTTWHSGLPEWAEDEFDILFFTVSGLNLAIPLVTLGKIYAVNKPLKPLSGQADWYMGILPESRGEVHAIDTAELVMPERADGKLKANAEYVISLSQSRWALAANAIHQPVRLKKGDVKWRVNRNVRPWMAGTIKEKMCVLMDAPEVIKLLDESSF